VEVLDAKYDEDEGILLIFIKFHDMGGSNRILIFNRDDYHNGTDDEMRKTEQLALAIKGRVVNWAIPDDPGRKEMSVEEMSQAYTRFVNGVGETMETVKRDLENPDKQIERKIASVIRKEKGLDDMIRKLMD
jgi:hypothetical protein